MNQRSTHLTALSLVALLAVSCGSGGGGDFNLISIEDEWRLGEQLSQDVARQVRLSNDAAANAYVTRLGRQIVAQTPMANLPWQFHVVEDPAINAFAIPGGHVYINTGLIASADNASELAGVMAHEISHIVARHSTEQISRQYGLSMVASIALGQNPGELSKLAANIIAGGTLARFSREAEREADDLGIQYMYAANYDPRGMASMFRELLEHQKSRPGALDQFFSTHPATEERVRESENRAARLAARENLITDEPEFQALKRRYS